MTINFLNIYKNDDIYLSYKLSNDERVFHSSVNNFNTISYVNTQNFDYLSDEELKVAILINKNNDL